MTFQIEKKKRIQRRLKEDQMWNGNKRPFLRAAAFIAQAKWNDANTIE